MPNTREARGKRAGRKSNYRYVWRALPKILKTGLLKIIFVESQAYGPKCKTSFSWNSCSLCLGHVAENIENRPSEIRCRYVWCLWPKMQKHYFLMLVFAVSRL
jgi:hypothetical protein